MKRKWPGEAVGHGLGPSYVRGLHEVLLQERARKSAKKAARMARRRARLAR